MCSSVRIYRIITHSNTLEHLEHRYTDENQERFVTDAQWRWSQIFKLRLEIRMRQRAALLKRILIACPSVVNERDRQGNSPLHLATLHSAGMATIETLLKFGSDIRSRNNRKRTCVEICNEKIERIIERTRGANGGLTVSEFYAQSTQRALMISWGNLEAQARAAAQSLLGSGPQKKKKSKKKSKKKTMLSNTSSTDSSSSCSTPTEEDEIKLPEGSYSEVFDALSAFELESYSDRLSARYIGVENAMDLIYLDDGAR